MNLVGVIYGSKTKLGNYLNSDHDNNTPIIFVVWINSTWLLGLGQACWANLLQGFHLLHFIEDVHPEVIVLHVTAALYLSLPDLKDKPSNKSIILGMILLGCMWRVLALVDSFGNVVSPTKWHRKYLKRVQKWCLKLNFKFQRYVRYRIFLPQSKTWWTSIPHFLLDMFIQVFYVFFWQIFNYTRRWRWMSWQVLR